MSLYVLKLPISLLRYVEIALFTANSFSISNYYDNPGQY